MSTMTTTRTAIYCDSMARPRACAGAIGTKGGLNEAEDNARRAGWVVADGRHVCPKCAAAEAKAA